MLRLAVVCFAQSGPSTIETELLLERAYAIDAGLQGPRNANDAAALYQQAADAGDAFAQLRLGYLSETGDGVPQDYSTARHLYERAAASGLAAARLRLAFCHLEGWGGPPDKQAFAREVHAAAAAGEISAQRILSSMYFIGFAVPKDSAEAVKWLERAAALDDAEAQYALGRDAEKRRRLALMPNLSLPRTWYQLSAEQEYHAAMRAMARTFLTGSRADRNWQLGQQWLLLATETGDAEAPYILAVAELLHVDSAARNENKARDWLTLASARENMSASEVLALERGGRSLTAAVKYVLDAPFEERYVQRAMAAVGAEPTRRPVITKAVRPIYPQALHMTGTEGRVIVDFHVDTSGRVADAKVIETAHPLFSERALEAVRQWRFDPARKDGRLVKSHMRVPVIFKITPESLKGVDGILTYAYSRARDLGGQVLADASELRMAEPKRPLPRPKLAPGVATNANSRAMVLIVLDPTGKPQRAHVLSAEPAELGEAVVAAVMQHEFIPRSENGRTVSSNVVLPFRPARDREPALRAP